MSNTVLPLAIMIAEELTEKLERQITFRFPERIRSDISALSRAFGTLSTQDPAWAAEIIGLLEPPEPDIVPDVVDTDDDTQEVLPNPQPNVNGVPRRRIYA